ncbi:uncharacterized protein [Diadema setosum]|uniref:uncharacterized protein n=1 Tax=Diadema setosum TaxID=31175 RepID=UPI003B3A9FF0
MTYTLPHQSSRGQTVKVCRLMFMNTLGITEKQIRTVLNKKNPVTGVLGREKRGGNQKPEPEKRQKILEHLSKFPRVESHYCRSSSTCEYLSGDLTKRKMYRMFCKENPGCASYSLYRTVMREQNLKFHRPKKDKCGICESYRQMSEAERAKIKDEYLVHRSEIAEVRKLKEESKNRSQSDPTHGAAVFDLQQNIYLPKSNRGELFYKRRLACYNFTIYDLASHEGHCYLSNETITKRGACEVSTYLFDFLQNMDQQGKRTVDLFCDGCVGQNKNSIVAAMCHKFLSESTCVESVTIHFFESNHGQNEGDSIHATIEKCLSRKEEVFHPSQLHSAIAEARQEPEPYRVRHVRTNDKLDWRSYGQNLSILKCRKTSNGMPLDWKKIKQIRVAKNEDLPPVMMFKTSHVDKNFVTLELGSSVCLRSKSHRNPNNDMPTKLYRERPKLALGKYQDLLSLCTGNYPVIAQQDVVEFYQNLPHE